MGLAARKDSQMTEEMRRKLARLAEIAPKLNAATDKATEAIREAEGFLDSLSLGVAARSPKPYLSITSRNIEDEDGPEPRYTSFDRHLAYGRVGGKFRIHVADVAMFMVGDSPVKELHAEEVPWSSLPRVEKLEAFAQLPALIDAITAEVDRLVAGAVKAEAAGRETLDAIQEPYAIGTSGGHLAMIVGLGGTYGKEQIETAKKRLEVEGLNPGGDALEVYLGTRWGNAERAIKVANRDDLRQAVLLAKMDAEAEPTNPGQLKVVN
jgi:hypothetical protein